jgi:hypothetical protein
MVAAFDGAAYLPMDGFHLSNAVLDRLGRRDRKGAIDTFDAAGYVEALRRVRAAYARVDVYVPAFDRGLDEPVAAGTSYPPSAGWWSPRAITWVCPTANGPRCARCWSGSITSTVLRGCGENGW